MQEEPKIVPLMTGGGAPDSKATAAERLEEMIRLANLMAPENNQSGTGKKNTSKEVRARRRAQKLARKKSRYK